MMAKKPMPAKKVPMAPMKKMPMGPHTDMPKDVKMPKGC